MDHLRRVGFVSLILAFFLVSTNSSSFTHLCDSAVCPEHCLSSFGSFEARSAKEFATLAVKATLDELHELFALNFQNASYTNLPRSPQMEDCSEFWIWSIRQLNDSLVILQTSVWNRREADNVITWLSAALTNHELCNENFSFNSRMQNVSRHISSSLAIINAMSKRLLQAGTRNRRLLANSEASFPSWLTASERRILQAPTGAVPADAVVAQDGTGNFETIREALKVAPDKSNVRYVIHVKAGIYEEKLRLDKSGIMLIGDGKYSTIIQSSQGGASLRSVATFMVSGNGFIARDIGFENAAGLRGGQAIALLVASDYSVLYRCSIKSYQDTLYAYTQRQFFRECDIYGDTDFIFGNAAAIFQSCNIFARKSPSGTGYITAQGRIDPNQNTGFSLQNCRVTGDPGDPPSAGSTFLGRPWKQYSRTVYMESYLDSIIPSAGWAEWSGHSALKSLYYGEYMNSGPGAGTTGRVKWPGFHLLNSVEATAFTVTEFIGGATWLPSSGAPFKDGL
eukprot:TRINITY_DN3084_c0_g1_i4.p1 TRINITY_DN3084_c0_g1~~TRINITY_DN3084_c0_g1_i4.p1  ORF type:complete len:522 (+),score=1.15 TRINITY_DN3084_c0_g1_i4:39-1568(+)